MHKRANKKRFLAKRDERFSRYKLRRLAEKEINKKSFFDRETGEQINVLDGNEVLDEKSVNVATFNTVLNADLVKGEVLRDPRGRGSFSNVYYGEKQ